MLVATRISSAIAIRHGLVGFLWLIFLLNLHGPTNDFAWIPPEMSRLIPWTSERMRRRPI